LQAYVANPDNGLIKTIDANGYSISVSYYPTDLILSREFSDGHPSDTAVAVERSKYSTYSYFILSLSSDGAEALSTTSASMDYSSLVQVLSFEIGNYITLNTSTDEVPTADFSLNRTYGLSESTQVLIAFNSEKLSETKSFDFVLREFGLGIGTKKFQFSTSDISRVPELRF
jgi:hypothetical protein